MVPKDKLTEGERGRGTDRATTPGERARRRKKKTKSGPPPARRWRTIGKGLEKNTGP